jgi:hypothetical protein
MTRTSQRLALGALLLFLVAWPSLGRAQDSTSYSWANLAARGSAGVQGGYAWHTGTESNLPSIRKEWQVGLVGAYNLVPNLSLAAYVVRGFDNHTWRAAVGPRLTVWRSVDRKQAAAVGLAYAWHAGPAENLPRFPHEWEGNAAWGLSVSERFIIGASTAYGLDNKTFRSVLGVTYVLTGGPK